MNFEMFPHAVVCIFAAFGFFVFVLLLAAWASGRLHIAW